MAKGGGKGKGRPRKTLNLAATSQSPIASQLEVGECSYLEKTNGTVTLQQHEDLEILTQTEVTSVMDLDGEKETKAVQIEEGTARPPRHKGMALGYIAPIVKKGIPTACLIKSELEREAEKWKNAVILYVIGDAPTIIYLTSFLKKQCEIMGDFEIYYHTEGYFVVKFERREDRDKILYEGPQTIANRPIIVKEWVADFCFEKEMLREVPLWIRLPRLPLNCWSGDSLSRIGSVIGKPVCADECMSKQQRISYARLMVEVDITQPLKYSVQVEGEDGKMVEQKIYYEWIPLYCQKCQRVGHICQARKEMQLPKPQQKQWQRKEGETNKAGNEVDKGKGSAVDTNAWSKPKKTAPAATIQVGNLQISTANVFQEIVDTEEPRNENEGGDLIPSGIE